MALSKYLLNLAGEYRVAAELLKRGLFATITYGNMKGADIFAIGPRRKTAVIEVKASTSNRFVTSFFQKYKTEYDEHPDFWVLYRAATEGSEEFYVLSHTEMATAQAARNSKGADHDHFSWADHAEGAARGVDNVLAGDLQQHRDAWEKILDWMAE